MEINVYLFHRVSPDVNKHWPPVSPRHFGRIIKYLSENYHVIQLEDYLINDVEKGENKPLAAVVFDDGYKDILTYAAPILSEYRMPYSIYVVTDSVDTGMPIWTYKLDRLFSSTKVLDVPANPDLPASEFPVSKWRSDLERISYGQTLKAYLKNARNEDRLRLVEHFEGAFSDVEYEEELMLNWEDLRALQGRNCQIGSHTRSHPILINLENEQLIKAELEYSKTRINEELGQNPVTISYPNGNYNELIRQIAARQGYQIGLAVGQRAYNRDKDDMMSIPRVQLYEESMVKTILRMNGTIEKVKKILKK